MTNGRLFVVSGFHIQELLRNRSEYINISLDLGLTLSQVKKTESELILPDGQRINTKDLEKANKRRHLQDCFLINNNLLYYIYSFENKSVYKLYEPHIDWPPTLWINSSMMHTVSVSKPTEEAVNKVGTLGKIKGNVLDTCFGLGYTSIELARAGADCIKTFEISQSVIQIAQLNPWSKEAFLNKKIKLENSDIYTKIKTLNEQEFDLILHDPPNVKIQGDLYSSEFYTKLYRVLKNNGKIYHFIGGGRIPHEYKVNYVRGVVNRLSKVGFRKVEKSYRGVIAVK